MRETARTEPLFRKVDCLEIPVPDLESGLAFYRDRLGHELLWRTDTQAGLRLPDTDAEIVLQTERPEMAIDLLVTSAEEAAAAVEQAFEALTEARTFHNQDRMMWVASVHADIVSGNGNLVHVYTVGIDAETGLISDIAFGQALLN